MVNFLLWIIVGAVIGWAASVIMKTNNRQGLIADIIAVSYTHLTLPTKRIV